MIKRIIIGVVALLVIATIGIGGVYYWKKLQASKTSQVKTETEVQLRGLEEISETPGIEPEADIFPGETGEQVTESTSEDATAPEGITLETEPSSEEAVGIEPEISGALTEAGTRDITARESTSGTPPRETRPSAGQPTTRPGQSGETAPTSVSTPPAATSAPTPTPTPGPAPGNYSVRTIEPVSKSQLAVVRKAMEALGVGLQERKTEQQQLSAYRIAIGYFRTKAEAESWAYYNFRPRGIDYYVYPVQGMFSIQVGVYAQQQNVEPAMREFYRKYQGGRLPVRTEMTTIAKPAYELSISRITKSLADEIWRELSRLGIQAEISGI